MQRLAGRGGLALSVYLFLVLLAPSIALAHPLGNFTVNRHSRIEVGADAVRVWHVVDNAEIPSVQERQAADTDRDGTTSAAEWDAYKTRKVEDLRRGLEVTLDGRPLALTLEDSAVELSVGQADLPLVRIEARFRAGWAGGGGEHRAAFRERNEPARLGWREIVVRADDGISLVRSSAPAASASDELRTYPDNLLQSPLDQRQAEWTFTATPAAVPLPRPAPREVMASPPDAFASLVTASDLNLGTVLLAMLASAVLGGVHAASPGHGKTVMAAYIVGTRGNLLHALTLAMSVTVSHTAGVLLLGAVTLLASNLIFPEQLYPWLTLGSGAIVLVIGLGLLVRGARGGGADWHDHGHGHGHDHDHGHGHGHGHRHDHEPEPGQDHEHAHSAGHGHSHDLPLTWRTLFALGLAGGIVPSASALVVLLSALALGRLGFGLLLIVAFGMGMALVLTATGVLFVYAGRLIARFVPESGSPLRRGLARVVPRLSALAMTLVGLVVTAQALSQLGLLGA